MKLDKSGLDFIKKHEGCKLKAYLDSAKVYTIGYGNTNFHVHKGMTITQGEADNLFAHDVQWAEKAVNKYVKVPMTQSEFTALVDFVFNIGTGAFRKSTLVRKLNDKNYSGASEEFSRWTHAGGKVLKGLVTRREDERQLFLA